LLVLYSVNAMANGSGFPDFLEEARVLFREYEEALGIDLCFQGFEQELADLPGAYAWPGGELFVAHWGGLPAGCGAFRPAGDRVCEMKRLYVRQAYRGKQIGRTLAVELMQRAAQVGYEKMRLDTLRRLVAANRLYADLGFTDIAPYNINPEPDVVYMERALSVER
jgi:putative acetyltransferase